MNLPVTLPDWLPWWVPLLLLVPAVLWGLAFLLLPFSVIGLKGRLEMIEARLDEIQGEIRSLTHRLPEPIRQSSYDDVYAPPGMTPRRDEPPMVSRPPIPPAAHELEEDEYRPPRTTLRRPEARGRAEPRLDWPR